MRSKFLDGFATMLVALLLAGCYTSQDGRQHFGSPFAKDTIEGRYERPVLDCWTAAKDVLNHNGKLYSEDHLKSTLEASVNERTVWVKVVPLDQRVTRVIVQARGGSNRTLAAEIDKQIAIRLATGNLTPSMPAGAAK
jgi:hypothetical protein